MDYAHRRHKSVSAVVPPGADSATKMYAAQIVTAAWEELEGQLLQELLSEGFSRDQISLRQLAYMKYYGHLDDLEVASLAERLASEQDVDALIARFEDVFTKSYTLAGKPPYATYQVDEVSVVAQVSTVKPLVRQYALEGKKPPAKASKGTRQAYQDGQWHEAQLYEMDELRPGNEISGIAVIEAPSTTLFVPKGWRARLDEYEIFWLEKGGKR
jgi:N-methylhydantoinase A/oxoprolinase/acetone carboxylase beta subunit